MKDQITYNGKKYKAIREDRTASIIQHHERELQKYLDKPNKSYSDEEEIQRLRNAIAYAKSKQESVNELKTFKAISKQTGNVVYFRDKKEMDAAFKKKLVRKIGTFESTEESVNESVNKKVTVKEIKSWMKSLEEFRYRKIPNVDARRITSFVNNGLSETDLPQSLQKKWGSAKYSKEKGLADRFMKERINKKLTQNESKHPLKEQYDRLFKNKVVL
jgi:hypothetical protein